MRLLFWKKKRGSRALEQSVVDEMVEAAQRVLRHYSRFGPVEITTEIPLGLMLYKLHIHPIKKLATEAENPLPDDPYAVLGLSRYATKEQILTAYRAAAKRTHPDSSTGSLEAFKRVQAAGEKLGVA